MLLKISLDIKIKIEDSQTIKKNLYRENFIQKSQYVLNKSKQFKQIKLS